MSEILRKRTDETQWQYVKRITDNRKEYDMDYSEWAKAICDYYFSSDNGRKAYYIVKPLLEQLDDEIFKLQWLTKRVKVMWWYQNIYYLGYSPVANAWKTTNFDFYSIMLYEGTLVNTNYYFVHKYPYPSVQFNYELSTKDIETVKRMYR